MEWGKGGGLTGTHIFRHSRIHHWTNVVEIYRYGPSLVADNAVQRAITLDLNQHAIWRFVAGAVNYAHTR